MRLPGSRGGSTTLAGNAAHLRLHHSHAIGHAALIPVPLPFGFIVASNFTSEPSRVGGGRRVDEISLRPSARLRTKSDGSANGWGRARRIPNLGSDALSQIGRRDAVPRLLIPGLLPRAAEQEHYNREGDASQER